MTALNFSINTNPGALIALQALAQTNSSLATTQERINTGFEVGGAEDNAAIFAIAQNLRGDLGGLNAVAQSLDRATSALGVAIEAGETISDLLIMARETVTAASDEGLDAASRAALNNDYVSILEQINAVVDQAEFNGTNIISSNPDNISALVDGDAINSIDVTGTTLTVSGLSISTLSFGTATQAQSALNQISLAFSSLNTVLARFGAGASQIELQQEFTQILSDTIEVGVGNLVDADLARESADLQALQVQQQLGLQALSIANAAPSVILSLFT